MAYQINGFAIPRPSMGVWQGRKSLGVDGWNRTIYSPVRGFELTYDAIEIREFHVLQRAWYNVTPPYTTVTLPQFDNPYYNYDTHEYSWTLYSGVVIDEPEAREYLQGFRVSCKLTIRNIVTGHSFPVISADEDDGPPP